MGGLVGLFLVDGRFAFFEFGVELLFTFVYQHVFLEDSLGLGNGRGRRGELGAGLGLGVGKGMGRRLEEILLFL